jgi:hypothetical protein
MSARRRRPACRHCGDARGAHQPGDWTRECWKYRPERPWTRLLAWIRQPPAPVPADVLHPRPVPYRVRGRAGLEDRTLLDIRIARPFTAGQVGPHVPRQREGSS